MNHKYREVNKNLIEKLVGYADGQVATLLINVLNGFLMLRKWVIVWDSFSVLLFVNIILVIFSGHFNG